MISGDFRCVVVDLGERVDAGRCCWRPAAVDLDLERDLKRKHKTLEI